MAKPLFLYATGTSFLASFMFNVFGTWYDLGSIFATPGREGNVTVNGVDYYWDGNQTNEIFPQVPNRDFWDVRKVNYPAAIIPGTASIEAGVQRTIAAIQSTPRGTPFALGGYSQGAAVMSHVLRELQSGEFDRMDDFIGATVWGNPMRQTDCIAPGLTWSGADDIPGSTTGGHGVFPDRLTNCDQVEGIWREYVNAREVVTSVGDSQRGLAMSNFVGWFVGQPNPLNAFAEFLTLGGPLSLAFDVIPFWLGQTMGHGSYPFQPPPFLPDPAYPDDEVRRPGKTTYELAADFLNELANEWSVTPIVGPEPAPVETGWQTTLVAAGSPTLSAGWSTTL